MALHKRLKVGDLVRVRGRSIMAYPLISRVTMLCDGCPECGRPNVILEDEDGKTAGFNEDELELVTFRR